MDVLDPYYGHSLIGFIACPSSFPVVNSLTIGGDIIDLSNDEIGSGCTQRPFDFDEDIIGIRCNVSKMFHLLDQILVVPNGIFR